MPDRSTIRAILTAAFSALVFGCASKPAEPKPMPPLEPEWRFVPSATVLGERRQFFLYGKRVDSAQISAPPSVRIERGNVKADGRVLSVYMKVEPLAKDSMAQGEKVGSRDVLIKTPDTTMTVSIKVIDEVPH